MNTILLVFTILPVLPVSEQKEESFSRLFAATERGSYISYSWGEQWERLRSEVRGYSESLTTFACLGPVVFTGGTEGLFVSRDYGESYLRVETFPGNEVTTITTARLFELEPVILVGTTSGIYRSMDGGTKWNQIGSTQLQGIIHEIKWPGPELFVASDDGLYMSTDIGESWKKLGSDLPARAFLSIALSRFFLADPKIFVGSKEAGLYRSSDGGYNFERLGEKEQKFFMVNALFWWKRLLMVGTNRGLYLLDNANDNLVQVESLRDREILSILVPAPEAVQSDILLGTDAGVFKSSDGGQFFKPVHNGLGTPRVVELSTFPIFAQNRELSR